MKNNTKHTDQLLHPPTIPIHTSHPSLMNSNPLAPNQGVSYNRKKVSDTGSDDGDNIVGMAGRNKTSSVESRVSSKASIAIAAKQAMSNISGVHSNSNVNSPNNPNPNTNNVNSNHNESMSVIQKLDRWKYDSRLHTLRHQSGLYLSVSKKQNPKRRQDSEQQQQNRESQVSGVSSDRRSSNQMITDMQDIEDVLLHIGLDGRSHPESMGHKWLLANVHELKRIRKRQFPRLIEYFVTVGLDSNHMAPVNDDC